MMMEQIVIRIGHRRLIIPFKHHESWEIEIYGQTVIRIEPESVPPNTGDEVLKETNETS